MSPFVLVGIAVSLAMDAFAVSVACSAALRPASTRQIFRLSFHFGLFQAIMPLIGWYAGATVSDAMAPYDHWVAFLLLGIIGVKAIRGAIVSEEHRAEVQDPTRGMTLVMLSVATSLDALAVGVSFSFLHVRIWTAAAVIGLVAATATLVGMTIGGKLGMRFGKAMELVGGIVLVLIGVRIVLDHVGIW